MIAGLQRRQVRLRPAVRIAVREQQQVAERLRAVADPPGGDVAASPAEAEGTRVLRDGRGGQAETSVYALASQRPGARGSGPAVIEGPFFTMRVPEGWQFDTTAAGDLRLTDRGQR